jgi:hypothetical protein
MKDNPLSALILSDEESFIQEVAKYLCQMGIPEKASLPVLFRTSANARLAPPLPLSLWTSAASL